MRILAPLLAPRTRPFSYMSMTWTDTGERPWWWRWLLFSFFFVYGLTNLYKDGDIVFTVWTLLAAGCNIGYGQGRR